MDRLETKETRGILWSVRVFFAFLEVRRRSKYCLMRDKFSFLYVGIWFDMMKSKFIVKNNSFKMLVVFAYFYGGHKNNFHL